MRICDNCGQVTQRLEVLQGDLGCVEVCNPCQRRLLDLFHDCEKEIAVQRIKLRQIAVEKWKQERSPKQNAVAPPG